MISNLHDILSGGIDTASASLEWVMIELLRHPLILHRLETEVRQILKHKESITDEDLGEMKYHCITVFSSLHPHAPHTDRIVREDVRIMGSGRRGCLGIRFSITSIEFVLTNLMHKFDWGLPNGIKWEDLEIIEHPEENVSYEE
ncbi:hypothetical protein ACS0TY_028871 [Phlomoides rotata]